MEIRGGKEIKRKERKEEERKGKGRKSKRINRKGKGAGVEKGVACLQGRYSLH